MNTATVLALKTRIRALVFSIRPAGVSAESSRGRPAVSPPRDIFGTSTKFIELVREWGAGSIDSLFAREYSLFQSVGNAFPTDWICTGISAELALVMPEMGEIPCSFPVEQGIARRDEFAPDSPHRH